jgi:hypothetical protein
MSSAGLPEILSLLITAILPILAIGLFIYLIVRLAIRHEHRNHER